MRSSFLFSFRIQILCFLLALKGITSGMIWDAATSAKGQMSIGREDLVVLPPGSPTKKLSCAPRCKAARLQGWEALMQHVYEPYKRGLRAFRNFLLLFNNESATVFPQFSSTKSSLTQWLKIAKKKPKEPILKMWYFWWSSNTVLYKHQCIFLKTFLFSPFPLQWTDKFATLSWWHIGERIHLFSRRQLGNAQMQQIATIRRRKWHSLSRQVIHPFI